MPIPSLPPRMDRATVLGAMQGQKFPMVAGEFKEHVLGYKFNPEKTENGKKLSANLELRVRILEAPQERYVGRVHSIKIWIGGKFPEYEMRDRWSLAAAILGTNLDSPEAVDFDGNAAEADILEADAKGELEGANRHIWHTRTIKKSEVAVKENGQAKLVEKENPRDSFIAA